MENKQKKRTWLQSVFTMMLSIMMVWTMIPGLFLNSVAYAAVGQTPPHTKNITDNHDGTYTISLDVVGDSEKQPNNVNVIVVFDKSGSMNNNRMSAAKTAVNNLANSLFAYNESDPDTVEMALVDFSTNATAHSPTNSATTFRSQVNNLTASGGTNWEAAMKSANNINFGDDDQTFVIFVSDGNPTFRDTRGNYGYLPQSDNRQWSDWYGNATQEYYTYRGDQLQGYSVYGLGSDNSNNANYSPTSMDRCYDNAVDDAKTLVNKVGADHFFTIGAYGDVSRMQTLTTEAGAPAGNFYNANDTAALNQALSDILAKIEVMGIGNASINDGTTNQVTTTSGEVAELLEVDESSYKYYRSGGDYGTMQPWSDAPEAKFENGSVKWDLASEGVLENGVRYTVTFDCYPSQETYDTIARLKNGDLKYADLDPEIKKYIVDNENGTYSLRTNTNATLSWDDTRDDAGQQEAKYTNPDPVRTDASTLTAIKEWEGEDPDTQKVTMTILMDDKAFDTTDLTGPEWSTSSYISYGLIKNGKVLKGAEGHDFKFAELDSTQYHWELETPTVHPMIIDGTPTMLVMVDDKHPASGKPTYTINGKEYYVDSSAAGLKAVNHRRSNLNLKKIVTGEDAPANAEFPFTLTVNNSKANDPSSTDTDSDNFVWFSIYDTAAGKTVTDATVSGVEGGPNADGYYWAKSGAAITVNMKADWNLRFTNLPSGTTYTFEEGTLDEGFVFTQSDLTEGTDSTFSGDKTTTGTIETTKTSYQVEYTNDYALTNLEITKVWDDADDQDGLRLTADELKAQLTLDPAVEGKQPDVKDNGDGTYTITYTGLPRYDSTGKKEVEYKVTESEITGYTPEGSPAEDDGTITNKHDPETTEVPVEKKWIGPAGDEVTVTLYADGEATDKTLKLNEGNKWKDSFKDLPVNKDHGTEIKYTVVEAGVSGVDASKYSTAITGDAENGYVITNTNTETVDITVTKAWDDASNQDDVRPGSLELTLTPAVEGKTPEITKSGNNWTYKWTGLPKYDSTTGDEIEYSVKENNVPADYEIDGSDTASDKGTITNKHEPAETEASVEKVWDDKENQDGKRPESLTVTLYADGEPTETIETLSESNQWKATKDKLPKFKAGKEIKYTWVEDEDSLPEGYTLTKTDFDETNNTTTLTNSYETETTTASVRKVWDDAENQDGKRPGSLTVKLLANGEDTGKTVTLDDSKEWKDTIEGLDAYAAGQKIEYTWDEGTLPEGYELTDTSVSGTLTTLTNSHTPETIDIPVKKEWTDFSAKSRPESITVTLKADGETAKTATVTPDEDGNWAYTFEGMPVYAAGKEIEYTVEESAVAHYDSEVTGSVEEGFTIKNTYNFKPAEVVLEGSKNINDLYPADADPVEFTFTLTGEGQNQTKTVKGAGKFTFDKLTYTEPGEYEYTVSETAGSAPGWTYDDTSYTVKVKVEDNGAGQLEATVTGNEDGLSFSNTYEPEAVEVELSGTKNLEGRDLEDGEFAFILKDSKEEVVEKVSNADGKFAFKKLSFDKVGEYKYTIEEENTGLGGVTYDKKVYDVTISVTDDGTGKLAAKITGLNEDGSGADFTNTYEAKPTKVKFSGSKSISGYPEGAAGPDVTFEFTLSGDATDSQTVTGKGDFEFKEVTLDEVKTYTFTIAETKGSAQGWTYDTNSYEISVEVKDNGKGQLVPNITGEGVNVEVSEDGTQATVSGAAFKNLYQAEPDELTIVGKKVLDDYEGDPLQGGEFTFEISGKGEVVADENTNEEQPTNPSEETVEEPAEKTTEEAAPEKTEAPAENADEAKAEEAQKEADAKVDAAEEKLEAAEAAAAKAEEAQKEAEAKAEEAKDAAEETKADEDADAEAAKTEADKANEAVEEAKDAVEEANEAVEEAKAEVEAAKEDAEKAESEATETKTEAEKTETVADPSEVATKAAETATEAAEAVVETGVEAATETIDAPLPESGNTAKNDKDGFIEFANIKFERAGKYTYEIKEIDGSMAGVTNDTKPKKVVVEVKDDGSGKLKAQVTDPAGEDTIKFEVHNKYVTPPTPSKVTDSIPVTKELAGHSLKAGDFTFELECPDGKVITAKNDADGNVEFPAYTFTKAGTYKFAVRERKGNKSTITYDGAEYEVTANVKNNYDGEKLEVEWVFEGGEEIVFNNSYKDVVYIDPPVKKVVEGDPDKTETYTFLLEANDEANPMPKAADGESSMEMSIEGAGKKEFGKIAFTEPGAYSYTVTEVEGDNPDCEYDDSVYTVIATVTEDSNYKLHVKCDYRKNGKSINTAEFKFVNTYEEEPGKKVKTGDDNNLIGWLAVMALAGAGGGAILYRRRREDD